MSSSKAYIPLALLALCQALAAAELPSAGGQLRQIPPSPVPERTTPGIHVEPAPSADTQPTDGRKILVRNLVISGASAYPEDALVAITGFKRDSELTLGELHAMAGRITEAYHRDGYLLAQAYLPEQEIRGGVVIIAVLEGRYGKIEVRNQSNLSGRVVNSILGGIDSGEVVRTEPLESRLLLLSDIAGVNTKSTLMPGASTGASDLLVDLTPGQRISGSIDADNAGNRYTGAYRIGATVNINNPLGQGDVASLRALSSGSGLNYGRASYQIRAGKSSLGVAYSRLGYKLGKEFGSLEARGNAAVATIYGSYPLIRSRNANLYAQLAFDARTFHDRVDATGAVSDKKSHVLMASLYGDRQDSLGAGGISNAMLTLTTGTLDIQTAEVRADDAATAGSNGHYSKLNMNLARLQNVGTNLSLYAGINAQLASKNLDISEKMELGGVNGVRAYPEGEAFADQGYLLNLEARYRLPPFRLAIPGQTQLLAFVDTGTVTLHKNPWAAGPTRRTLSGAGIGLNFIESNNYTIRAFYARKIGGGEPTSAPDRVGRFWLQLVKYF